MLQDQQAAGWQVVFTSQTPLGQIWDWVTATVLAARLLGLRRRGQGATSLGKWLDNDQVSGVPSNPDRLYAGVRSVVDNAGASVNINSFGGFIEAGTLTCHEMVVGCRVNGVMWQQIGIASIRDSANADRRFDHKADSLLRLEVEFLSAGPDSKDKDKLGWDGVTSINKFKAPPFRPYGPGAFFSTSTISTVDGVQYESFYQIKVKDGAWWVAHNGHWLGYYPADLFKAAPSPNLADLKACEVDLYGEVYDKTPVPWTKTPMVKRALCCRRLSQGRLLQRYDLHRRPGGATGRAASQRHGRRTRHQRRVLHQDLSHPGRPVVELVLLRGTRRSTRLRSKMSSTVMALHFD